MLPHGVTLVLALLGAPLDTGAADGDALAVLADPKASLEAKRDALAKAGEALEPPAFTELVRRVEPRSMADQLCLELPARVVTVAVRVTALSSFGEEVRALVQAGGQPDALAPITTHVAACLHSLKVTDVESGETRELHLSALDAATLNEVRVRFSGPPVALVLGAVGDLSSGLPGSGYGSGLNGGGGVRLDWWSRYAHLTAAGRVGTFAYRGEPHPIVMPVVDLFAGFGRAFGRDELSLRCALDLGLWALVTPTVRATGALAVGRLFFTASLDLHLMPMVSMDEHGVLVAGPPDGKFLFWGGELSFGWRL